MESTAKASLKTLGKTLDLLERDLLQAKYDRNKLSHISAIALAIQSIELAATIYHVSGYRTKSGIPVLLRSLLECSMRIVFLLKDPPKHALSLELIDNLERLNLLEDASYTNPFAKKLLDRNKHLKREGGRAVSFRDMLKQGDAFVWNDFYSMLSAFSHGQLSALGSQSMEATPGGANIQYQKPVPEHILIGYYEGANQLVGIAVQSALNILSSAEKM